MSSNVWIQILIMAGVTYLIRVMPLTLIRKPIKNQFIRSFLYYVPYVTLAVMTFPAILHASSLPAAGLIAFIIGIVMTWMGGSLFQTAAVCCVMVFVIEKLL